MTTIGDDIFVGEPKKYCVGYTQTNKQGLTYKVIEYIDRDNISVQFDDGFIVEHIPVTKINQNTLYHPDYPIPKLKRTPIEERVGETKNNNQGRKMTIINYRSANDIDVQFENGFIVEHTQYQLFERGSVSDPFFPTFYGVGYMGMRTTYTKSGEYAKPHEIWSSMIKRCYNEKCQRHKWYEDCIVDKRWHNFATFYKWWKDNYYELPDGMGRVELDKDFKDKHSRIYGPHNCLLIPQRINGAVPKRRTIDKEFPIGITFNKEKQKYHVRVTLNGKDTHIGNYNTFEEAFSVFKSTKESELKRLAELYKPYIPKEVYDAVINYRVEITD